jgi:hypothetical protein
LPRSEVDDFMACSLGKPLKLSFEKLIGKSPYLCEITHTHNFILTYR